jgi:hypothetical protein
MESNPLPATGKYPERKRSYTIQSVVRAVEVLNAFSSTSEVLDLRVVAGRVHLNKGTTFRVLETLVETGLLERAGKQGYRSSIQTTRAKRFRLGYASQSNLLPFTSAVIDGLITAASAANIELLILNNKFSARTALQNADNFVSENVDLVIDSRSTSMWRPKLPLSFRMHEYPTSLWTFRIRARCILEQTITKQDEWRVVIWHAGR